MKKKSKSKSRTIEPIQNLSASGKAKRLPKQPIPGCELFWLKSQSKYIP